MISLFNRRTFLVLFLVIGVLSGCYRIRYEVAPPSPRGSLYTDQRWNNYFLFGFLPSNDEFEMGQLCRSDELKEIRSYRTPGNVLATFIGCGLVAASTVEISCHQTK